MAIKCYVFGNTADREERRMLLSGALYEYTGSEKGEIYFDGKGRPCIRGTEHTCHMSATATGEHIVCVFSDKPIGIDGEYLARFSDEERKKCDYAAIAERFFSDEETEYCRDGDAMKFIKVWVRKEAYCRYTGKGMMDFPNFNVSDGEKLFSKVNGVPLKKFNPDFKGNSDYLFIVAGDID